MTRPTTAGLLRRSISLLFLLFAAVALLGLPSSAQVPNRIAPDFSASEVVPIKGSLHPLAKQEYDRGRASGITKVPLMTLVFSPSATQQADLTALLAAQQNQASPLYHQWLTPAQYAARFGMSNQDLATTEAWLQAQGFTVLDVANGRNAIHFSGTVAQVEAAFQTEMHQYLVNGTTHLANSTMLSLPASFSGAVAGVRGLAQFRPHPLHTAVRHPVADSLKPQYTSSISGDHFIAPGDITTIYDVKALYNAGYTGTGQNIAIVGQSAILTSDIDAFRSASGLAAKDPTLVLVPNTGASTIYGDPNYADEGESDLDLEWSGAIAPAATVYFVYAGATGDVFDALEYAIDSNTAPVVSLSYGECEAQSSDASTLEPELQKANAQGQTILVASGDGGATGCDSGASATSGLSTDYPASSTYVTAMGGTEFNEGSTNYWNSTNDSLGGSAISYIPEVAWNETAASIAADPTTGGISSTGGGQSIYFTKPSWQVATNVPNDGARDVPDISLDAASIHDGFLYCSAGSCVNGFRDTDNTLTTAGGTSFDAPIFAGILSLINQKNGSTGAGNINPALYALYATTPAAFHDITGGNNEQPCTSGTTDCPTGTTEIGYSAGLGYDLTTGLGTIDAYNLAVAFPAGAVTTSGSLLLTNTVLSASTLGPAAGTSVTFTAAVTAAAGGTTPTGTVQFAVNGVNVGSPVALTSGTSSSTAVYTTSFPTIGTDTVTATYSGNTANAGSTSNTLTITVGTVTAPAPSFTLAATNVTLSAGSSAATTVTLTSLNGYAGTVDFGYTSSASFTGCIFGSSSKASSANAAVTTTLTVDTLTTDCVSTGSRHLIARAAVNAASTHGGQLPWSREREYPIAAAALLAGFALLGCRRKGWPVVMVLLLGGLGTLGLLSGCGGSSSSSGSTGSTVPKGTYTITLTGTDSTTSTLTATTTFTVTVQ